MTKKINIRIENRAFKKLSYLLLFLGLSIRSFSGNNEDLLDACKKGDLVKAKAAIDAGADVNFKDVAGYTPLSVAFFSPEVTKLLLDKKADPNGGNAMAMSNAAGVGSLEVMKLLLAAGADPNKPLVVDIVPGLQKALDAENAKSKKDRNKKYISVLEEQIEKAKKDGGTKVFPVERVVKSTLCVECLQLLIDKGAKVDIVNPSFNTNLLHEYAAIAVPPADWIINVQAQVGGWQRWGVTVPVWYSKPDATKLGTPDAMIKLLVKSGVDINGKTIINDTPLHECLRRKTPPKSEVVIALINNGADVNAEGSFRNGHALLQAAGLGMVDVMELMLAKGADLNREFKVDDPVIHQTLKGITPLMWAVRNGQLEATKYLVGKGVKLEEEAFGTSFNFKIGCLTRVKNKTAIYYAIEGQNLEVVKYLVENTKVNWGKPITIDVLNQKTETDILIAERCMDDKAYKPSAYAKACNLTEMADYLKHKDL